MSSSIHGEFKLINTDPSLIYVLPQTTSSKGSFTDGSVNTGWLIKKITSDQGNTLIDAIQGVSVSWDFAGKPNKPAYIAVIAGYEMPNNAQFTTRVNGVDTPIEITGEHDAFFYIALTSINNDDPEQASGPWASITISVDITAAGFNNDSVTNNPNDWNLYYLPSTEDLLSGGTYSVIDVGGAAGNGYTINMPDGDISGRYIFGKISQAGQVPTPQVNINTASLQELIDLPEIGTILAQRIIDERPFGSVDELTRVNGIDQATVDAIRSLITA